MSARAGVPASMATGWRVNAVGSGSVRTVRRNGRDYLQFPLIALSEMVLNYPENGTKEYLPASSIRETSKAWDGTPLTYVHPENRNRTVNDPEAFMGTVIGAFHDPQLIDGGTRLKGNGLIDIQKAKQLGGEASRLVSLLRVGQEVSVSAGYGTVEDEFRNGTFEGESYDLVQGPPIPDHIAVFPSDSEMMARCSPEDGCVAPRANAVQEYAGSGVNRRSVSQETDFGVRQNMSESTTESGGSTRPTNDEGEPLAMRSEFEELKAMVAGLIDQKDAAEERANSVSGACECDGACECSRTNAGVPPFRQPNMLAVPGALRRNYDDVGRASPDPEEFPAGGRKAWERRKVGLDEVPSEDTPSGLATGRTAYEERKRERVRANAESEEGSSDDQPFPTGSRSSFERRQNAEADGAEQSWRDSEYPYSAKKQEEEREAVRQRQEELTERALKNEARLARERDQRGEE